MADAWEFVSYNVRKVHVDDDRSQEELLRDDYWMLVHWARQRGLATSPIHYTHIERTA